MCDTTIFILGSIMEKQIIDKLKYMLNKKKSLEEICEALGLSKIEVYGLVVELKNKGEPYDIIKGTPIRYCEPKVETYNSFFVSSENKISFCIMSDIHYASIYDRPDLMKEIYAECHKRGIDTILCVGDITDGYFPYHKDHEKRLKCTDAYHQADYVVNIHPYDPNIKFYFITGNHDYTHFENENVRIGEVISQYRKNDMIYLGQDIANLTINKLRIQLNHGQFLAGAPISTRIQAYTERLTDKPHILALGHIHQALYMQSDDIDVLQTGSILDQTPFLTNQKINSQRNCWFVNVRYSDDGNIYSITPELYDLGRSRYRKL